MKLHVWQAWAGQLGCPIFSNWPASSRRPHEPVSTVQGSPLGAGHFQASQVYIQLSLDFIQDGEWNLVLRVQGDPPKMILLV
jgi:hypothetical protein